MFRIFAAVLENQNSSNKKIEFSNLRFNNQKEKRK